jgi:hypothetical protein
MMNERIVLYLLQGETAFFCGVWFLFLNACIVDRGECCLVDTYFHGPTVEF